MRALRWWAAAAMALLFVMDATQVGAIVAGTPLSRFREFRLFGDAVATGNTLMRNTPSQPLVNSILLDSSSGRIDDIPRDATIQGAYLFWSGSIQGSTDEQARLTLADGAQRSVQADTCFTSPVFEGFFYCRADVTDLVEAHPAAPGDYNGLYTVSEVDARAAALDEMGQCINVNCQARYAGWSIVVVYDSPSETIQRDIVLYDGFRQLDENNLSAGIDTFVIDGFEVADPPQGTFRFFGLEGDALLGVPPQDLDADPTLRCTNCFDYIAFNGTKLSDPNNPQNNLFNSTTPAGGALGVDIDSFDVSNLVRPGDTSVVIEAGSGDGVPSAQGGGGESVFLGYVILSLNRLAPNFQTDNTFKSVDPSEAGPGETVFYTVTVTNDGSLDATNVVVQDTLNANLEYVAGSLRVDGLPVPEPGGAFPLAGGLTLGRVPAEGDNDVRITFRARVRDGVSDGTRITNQVTIRSREVPEPSTTNQAVVTVQAPELGQPTKTFQDLNGGDVEPGDVVTYTVTIPSESDRTASAIRLVDDMPPFVRLRSVTAPAGALNQSDVGGGINGTGRVDVQDITIPAAVGGASVAYTVEVLSTEELIAAGVEPEDINGLAVLNQARVQAPFLPVDLFSDDPTTPAATDPTVLRLTSSINLRNPGTFKQVEDLNGGTPIPGDTLRYTISLRNNGNNDATVSLVDDLPPRVTNFTLLTNRPEVTFAPAPAGANGTGRLTAFNLPVPARSEVVLQFTVELAEDAPGGLRIQNVASIEVREDSSQNQDLASDVLVVVSGADLEQSTKAIIDPPPGGFQPGDDVTYRIVVLNSGNRAATNVRVQDDIPLNLTNIRPEDGGVFDAGRRRATWTLGDLAPGASRELTLVGTIVSPLADGTQIRNQAVAFADNLDGGTVTDDPTTPAADDATALVVRSVPSLVGSTKAVEDLNGGAFEPGDPIRYTITVRNTGRDTAREIVVTDPIDLAGIDADTIQVLDGGSLSGGRAAWTAAATPGLSSLAPGEEVTLRVEAQLQEGLTDGTVIPNQATLTALGLEPTVSDDPATAEALDATLITVRATIDLSASLKAIEDANGGAVQPGDVLTYTVTVVNSGNGPARSVVIEDVVDGNLTSVAPAGGVFDEASRTIRWELAGPVPAGASAEVTFRAQVAPGVANGTTIDNQATINSIDIDNGPVPSDDPRNGVGDDDPTRVTVETRPDFVTSTKFVRNVSGEDGFSPGDGVIYLLTIRNSGTTAGTNVRVEDVLPEELEAIEPLDGGVLNGDRTVVWDLATLAAGEERDVSVRARLRSPIDDGTQVSNQAFITSAEVPSPVPTDNPNTPEEDDPTVFVVSSRPIFLASRKTFEDSNGGSVRPGDRITYTLTIVNSGTSAGRQVIVTDVVDDNLVDIDPGTGRFDAATKVLTWDAATTPAFASFAPGEALELTFSATVRPALANGTLISNQGSIVSQELDEPELTDDPRTADLNDPTTFPVVSAADLNDLSKALAPAGDGAYEPGDRVQYTIRFSNTGDAPAENVVVTDVLDERFVFASATDGGRFQAPTVTWDASTTPALASVAPGAEVVLRLEADLLSPIANGTEVFNQARVTADGFVNAVVSDDPSTNALDDPTLFEVTSAPDLTGWTKTVRDLDDDGFFEPGDVIEYTLQVRNSGSDDARQVVLTDPIDPLLDTIEPLDGGRLAGRTVTWDAAGSPRLAQVRPGDAGVVSVRVRATIRADATNGARVANQATAIAEGLDDVALSDNPLTLVSPDETVFIVTAEPRLDGFFKRVEDLNGGVVEGGDTLRYVLEVTNDGTQVATGATLRDPIDRNLVGIAPENGGVVQGDQIVWSLGDITPGETHTVSFTAQVRSGVADGTRIVNQAEATAGGLAQRALSDDPSTGVGDDDPTVVVVNARPELSVFTKTVRDLNGGFLFPGDDVEFEIRVQNTGTGPARDVVVRDPIDTSLLEDLRPGQNGRVQAGVVSWGPGEVAQLASLDPGESVGVSVVARVRAEVPNGTVILNQANLAANDNIEAFSDDPDAPGDTDPTRFEVRFPELASLSKEANDVDGGLLEAGDLVTYSLTLTAGAGEALANLSVVDPVDANLIDVQPDQGGRFVDGADRRVVWDFDSTPALRDVRPNQRVTLSFTARVQPDAEPGTEIRNQASASTPQIPGATELSDDVRNGLGDRDPTVVRVEVVAQADLSNTTKEVADLNGGTVEPGDTLEYTITVVNSGIAPTGAVNVIDPTPALTRYVAGSTTLDGAAQPDEGGESPMIAGLSVGLIQPGARRVVRFRVRVDGDAPVGAILSNQAIIDDSLSGTTDLSDDPTTAVLDDATQSVVGAGPNITATSKVARPVDDNGNGRLDVGELLEYTIRIPNRGNISATGVVLEDPLPGNVSYQAGSLTVNGVPLTDADDGDPGFVTGNRVTVVIGELLPGQAPEVRFRVRALQGTEVVNQGVLSGEEFADEPTDADGNEANGDQPTVTQLGGGPARVEVTKTVSDVNGDAIEPGDDLLYTIALTNLSGDAVEGLRLEDVLPQTVTIQELLVWPSGAQNGGQGQTVTLSDITLQSGQSGFAVFRVTLNQGVADGTEVCNVARVSGANIVPAANEPACVTVGARVGVGSISGRVFQDINDRDGAFDGDDDIAYGDFLVRAYRAGTDVVLAETISDEQGLYGFDALGAGVVDVRYFTRSIGRDPVQFGDVKDVGVVSAGQVTRDLLVDPSGRVYNALDGGLVNGAEVLIYYADEDPDPTRAGRLVAPDDLAEGQQGQLTRDGLYRFDVRPGRLYRVEVAAPNQALAFPSVRIPAEADFWNPDDDPREVVPSDLPDLNASTRYFTRFNIRDAGSIVENNHIPLDPLSSLIQLDKRANKREAVVGDVVTYTVQVTNRSSRDLTFDPQTGLGGVYIRDAIPKGLRYVKNSARLRRVVPGRPASSERAEPEGGLVLTFGLGRDDAIAPGRAVPMSLGAGETLELRYQLVVGVDAQPNTTQVNRAILVTADGSTPISNEDRASVRIIYDPIFDQGVVLGKVFCDADRDGWQDPGEKGIYRAKIFLDNGWYAITDKHGKFHFQSVDPGNHMIKLDVNSLPPGAEPTDDIRRVFYTTRGLPTKINFSATCPVNVVEDVEVEAGDALRAERERRRRARLVRLRGDVPGDGLTVEEAALMMPSAQVWVSTEEAAPQAPGADAKPARVFLKNGATHKPLVFNLASKAEGAAIEGWTLRVWPADAADPVAGTVWQRSGQGAPPASVAWDGTQGKALVLRGPAAWRVSLTVRTGDGATAISAPAVFGVDGRAQEELLKEVLTGRDLFRKGTTRPSARLEQELQNLRARLTEDKDVRIEVEVHTDDEGQPETLLKRTDGMAVSVLQILVQQFGIPRGQVKAKGFGGAKPLVPNLSDANRDLNNRVVIRALDPTPAIQAAKVAAVAPVDPSASANAKALELDKDGRYDATLPKPEDGLLVVVHRKANGAVSIRRMNVREGFAAVVTPQAQLPLVEVTGDLGKRALTVGAKPVAAPLFQITLAPPSAAPVLEASGLKPAVTLKPGLPQGLKAARYTLEILDLQGGVMHRTSGQGAPPERLRWAGVVDPDAGLLLPGWYRARLTVETDNGQLGQSAPVAFQIKPAEAPRRGRRGADTPEAVAPPPLAVDPQAFVNGVEVRVGQGGAFKAQVPAFTGQKIMIDVRAADGARAVLFAPVPDGFARPAGLAPGAATPVRGPNVNAMPSDLMPVSPAKTGEGSSEGDGGTDENNTTEGDDAEGSGGASDEGDGDGDSDSDGDGASGARNTRLPKIGLLDQDDPASIRFIDDGATRLGGTSNMGDAGGMWPQRLTPSAARPAGADSPVAMRPAGPLRDAPKAPRFEIIPGMAVARAGGATASDGPGLVRPRGPAQDGEAGGEPAAAAPEGAAPAAPAGSLEAFGADLLDDALRSEDDNDEALRNSPAANLKVELPPQGTTIPSRELVVRGSTDPANTLTINGQAVEVVEGEFHHPVTLPFGESELVIEAKDPDGNRGVIRWPVKVAEVGYFLMAFADTAVGAEGVELDGLTAANSTRTDGGTLLMGQAKLYLKGYMAGSKFLDNFFESYQYTAFFDTSRQAEFEEFMIDTVRAEDYYPIYGDSSETINDVQARGKLYIMVEADQSKLRVGNSRAALQGVQFFRYDKPFYGAMVDFNKVLGEGYKTEIKAFVTDEGQPVQHAYNYLRGTGGSIYFLRHSDLLEGSERINILIKDEASGLELARIPQTRNVDYTIDYRSGRILFKSPIPSVMRGTFLATRVNTTQQVLDGNPVMVEASYDYEADAQERGISLGGQVRETFFDAFTVGAGYVQENREDAPDNVPDYTLLGLEGGMRYTDQTRMVLEYAKSTSNDSRSLFSSDGGLTFDPFTRRDGAFREGQAWMLMGEAELGDLWLNEAGERWRVLQTRGWFQTTEPGFFSNGTVLDQGQDKFGGEMIWRINDHHTMRLRHDAVFTTTDDLSIPNADATKIIERQVTTAQYVYSEDRWTLTSEYTHTFFDDEVLNDGLQTDVIGQQARYRFTDQLSAYLGQQWVVRGDERIYDETLDRLQTDLGAEYRFKDDWSAELVQSLRWNGENATQLGLTTKLSETTQVYVKERIVTREDNEGVGTTSIVGGEERFADGTGRMYSEYHVDSGIIGDRSRAVMGLGKGFTLTKGLTLDVGYERSQVVDEQGVAGETSRDVISAGWELLKPRTVKFTQKFELRYDSADAAAPQSDPCLAADGVLANPDFCVDSLTGGQDKLQFLTANALTLTFWDDHNLLTRFILSTTNNLTLDREEERHMEASFGYALRPIEWDWVNLLLKYTYLQDMRPLGLLDWREEREHAHVISLVPIFELPLRLQLVEKLAWKRLFVRYDDLPEVESDTLLWINRLNYHLTQTIDAGVEYRFMSNSLSSTLKHGALLEVAYIFAEYARLGAGYNFTRFSDDELSDLDRDAGGFFIRLQGTY